MYVCMHVCMYVCMYVCIHSIVLLLMMYIIVLPSGPPAKKKPKLEGENTYLHTHSMLDIFTTLFLVK